MAETLGFVKFIVDKDTDEMLGAHIIGANVSDLIAEVVLAIEYRGSRGGHRHHGALAPDAERDREGSGARGAGPRDPHRDGRETHDGPLPSGAALRARRPGACGRYPDSFLTFPSTRRPARPAAPGSPASALEHLRRRRHAAAALRLLGHAAPELHTLGVAAAGLGLGQLAVEPLVDAVAGPPSAPGTAPRDRPSGGRRATLASRRDCAPLPASSCFVSVEHQAYFSSSRA